MLADAWTGVPMWVPFVVLAIIFALGLLLPRWIVDRPTPPPPYKHGPDYSEADVIWKDLE